MKPEIPSERVPQRLLIAAGGISLIYLTWWLTPGNAGNIWLYYLLFAGEIYHLVMAWLFWFTVWPGTENQVKFKKDLQMAVDVFIPVVSEPNEVVEKTIRAAQVMEYPDFKIYLLNDSWVAGRPDWEEKEELANRWGIECLTRRTPGGYKAGNINQALKKTNGEVVVIFDADMVPEADFLKKVIPYFADPRMGFVQTPQYYWNWEENKVTNGAWAQQKLFFGPIMEGKNRVNSSFICGTNVAIRRKALEEVGGMEETSIAEDFITSVKIHSKGWKSHYVKEVLARGMAPVDLLAYYKQQLRWARGSLEVLFKQGLVWGRGLDWKQKLQYLSSALYYLSGVATVIDMLMPLVFLMTGIMPVQRSTSSFAVFFLPFMYISLYIIYKATKGEISFRAMAYSFSSWTLQLTALSSIVLGKKVGFSVTPKQAQIGDYTYLAYPHLGYLSLLVAAAVVGIGREGLTPSVATNIAWALLNVILFWPFITTAGGRIEEKETGTQVLKKFEHAYGNNS